MIKGIGIDLIELDRIQTVMKKNSRFIRRVLTDKEMELYQNLQSDSRKLEFLAGRFAAKEAFSKAAGTGIGTLSFQDITISQEENGAPFLQAKGYEDKHIFISISHSRDYCVAQAVIESP